MYQENAYEIAVSNIQTYSKLEPVAYVILESLKTNKQQQLQQQKPTILLETMTSSHLNDTSKSETGGRRSGVGPGNQVDQAIYVLSFQG